VLGQPHRECPARRSPTAAVARPGTPNPRKRRNGWNDWPMRCRHSTSSSSAFMDHSLNSNEERGRGDRSVGEARQDEETTHALRHDDFGIDTTRDSAESVATLLAALSTTLLAARLAARLATRLAARFATRWQLDRPHDEIAKAQVSLIEGWRVAGTARPNLHHTRRSNGRTPGAIWGDANHLCQPPAWRAALVALVAL